MGGTCLGDGGGYEAGNCCGGTQCSSLLSRKQAKPCWPSTGSPCCPRAQRGEHQRLRMRKVMALTHWLQFTPPIPVPLLCHPHLCPDLPRCHQAPWACPCCGTSALGQLLCPKALRGQCCCGLGSSAYCSAVLGSECAPDPIDQELIPTGPGVQVSCTFIPPAEEEG